MNLVLLLKAFSKKLGLSFSGMPYMQIQVKGKLPPVDCRKLMLNHPSTKGFSGMFAMNTSDSIGRLCQHFITILSFCSGKLTGYRNLMENLGFWFPSRLLVLRTTFPTLQEMKGFVPPRPILGKSSDLEMLMCSW